MSDKRDAAPSEEEISAACSAYTRSAGTLRDVIRDVLIAARKVEAVPASEVQAEAVRKLRSAQMCHPNAVQFLIAEAIELLAAPSAGEQE